MGGIIGGGIGGAAGLLLGGVGAVPGAIIGAAIGNFFGRLLGARDGYKQAESDMKERNRQMVDKALTTYLDSARNDGRRALRQAMTDLGRAMEDELRRLIKRERETCKQSLDAIAEAQKLNPEAARKRATELAGWLRRLEHLQQRTMAMINALVQQTPGTGTDRRSSTAGTQAEAASSGAWADES
jgi:gas vesicle protein